MDNSWESKTLSSEPNKKRKAHEVLVKLAYIIGKAHPIMAVVEIDGRPQKIEGYDLGPRGIISELSLGVD